MNILEKSTVPKFVERLKKIKMEDTPRWGSMRPDALMAHLRALLELSLEERFAPDYHMPLAKTALFRWGTLYLPWPKGAKAPEDILPAPESALEEEREKLIATMNRFTEAYSADPHRKTRSPLLGSMTLQNWARLHGKHLNHHLKQFGC